MYTLHIVHVQKRLHTEIDALELNVTCTEHPSRNAAYCLLYKKVTTVNVHLSAACSQRKKNHTTKCYRVWSLFIYLYLVAS